MNRVIYVKYSNDRNPEFNMKTEIIQQNDCRIVRKCAIGEKSKLHIIKLSDNYLYLKDKFKNCLLLPDMLTMNRDYIELEYIEGYTLEEILDNYLRFNNIAFFKECLKKYIKEIRSVYQYEKFQTSKGFEKIFGNVSIEIENIEAVRGLNLGLDFSNIICRFDDWFFTDYEWVFDFLIPIEFLFWVACHNYMESTIYKEKLDVQMLYDVLGINIVNVTCWEKMYNNFIKNYKFESHSCLDDMNNDFGKNIVNFNEIERNLEQSENKSIVQIFYDYGDGFSEENSRKDIIKQTKDHSCSIVLSDVYNVKNIRIDPAEKECIIEIIKLCAYDINGSYDINAVTNGYALCKNKFIINNDDPQILFENFRKKTQSIEIEYRVKYI